MIYSEAFSNQNLRNKSQSGISQFSPIKYSEKRSQKNRFVEIALFEFLKSLENKNLTFSPVYSRI